jgi:ribonuclease J
MELGLLPKLGGAYRFQESHERIDAVVLTHAHSDHAAYISFLDRSIPVYCGETCTIILKALAETRARDLEFDLEGLNFRAFRTGEMIHIGDLTVQPCHVDHSIPGAYGFVVTTSAGTLVYTGDFRLHGTHSEMTRDFISLARKAQPSLMLSEGTNIAAGSVTAESTVREEIHRIVSQTRGLVISNFSYVDVDRFRTFRKVAEDNDRKLAISLKQAFLLSKLEKDKGLELPRIESDPYVAVYRRTKKKYYDWEKSVMNSSSVVEAADIAKEQSKYIAVFTLTDLNDLIEIEPKAGSNFILSMSEPFNEEQEVEFDRLRNWLDHFGLPMYVSHCSGHVMPGELRQAISEIAPTRLVPIHTEQPSLLSRYVRDVTDVVEPQKGQSISVS